MKQARVRYLWVWLLVVGLASAGGLGSAAAQSGDLFLPFVGSRGEAQEPLEQVPDEQEPDEQEPLDADGSADSGEDDAPAPLGPIEAEAFSAATWTVQNNLGVGTQAPASRIDVLHSANSIARLRINNSSAGSSAASNLYLQTGNDKGVALVQYGPGFTTQWGGVSLANRARLRTEVNTTGLILTTGGNAPLIFGTNDFERARISTNGNFGIGTSAPAHKLSVIGGPTWTNANWAGSVELANASAIGWQKNAGGQRTGMGQSGNGFYIFRTASDPGTSGAGARYDLMINDAGNVGIGTTTPAHKLSVIGGPAWTNSGWTGSVELANASAIGWQKNAGNVRFGMGQSTGGFYFFRTYTDPGTINDSADYHLMITDIGRIGIGTITPQSRLHVAGGDIRVTGGAFIDDGTTLTVPDYVFEPEYPLLTPDELRAYIAQEKHLPNVPSEAEIKAGGLNLSEFQMKLLEKVEELTLYSLAQEQEVDDLRQMVELLRQQNQTLETRLAALEEQE